jgi:hypothetical protein
MKKFLTFTAILLCSAIGATAHTESDSIQIKTDSILINIENLVESSYTLLKQESLKQRYKLYPTENIYTFLQLDTQTGAIEQVQWSLDSNKEFSITISTGEKNFYDCGPGSYELYPTKNLYQFILLDKVRGYKWHVQWGMKATERWVRRIY